MADGFNITTNVIKRIPCEILACETKLQRHLSGDISILDVNIKNRKDNTRWLAM